MGLRQKDLARMAGVDRSTLANWERGAKQPSLDTVVRLSEILGVSLDELVGTAGRSPSLPPVFCRFLASDPLVKLLAERSGVPAKAIAAFIVALQTLENGSGSCEQSGKP
jgi:transcriptional regulator with XRE-family HTH domain